MKIFGYPITNSINYLNNLKKHYNKRLATINAKCRTDLMKIVVNGNIYVCYDFPKIGNSLTFDFKNIWHSKHRLEISKKIDTCKKECISRRCNFIQNEVIYLPCNIDFRKDFFQIVDIIRRNWKFSKIVLNTNGRMYIYKDFCKEISKIGISQFNVYLCGYNSFMHDSTTGVNGSFEQTLQGIRNLKETKQNIKVIPIMKSESYADSQKLKSTLKKIGINENEIQLKIKM